MNNQGQNNYTNNWLEKLPVVSKTHCSYENKRKEQVVSTSRRIGQTRFTHNYICLIRVFDDQINSV